VGRADAQTGHLAGPVWLVRDLRNDDLRGAGASGRSRRACTAVMHDGCYLPEQCLLVHFADEEAILLFIDCNQLGPAPKDESPAALRADRLEGNAPASRAACIGMLPKPT